MNVKAILSTFVALVVVVGAITLTGCLDDNGDEKVVYWTQQSPVNMKALLQSDAIGGGIAWEPYCSDIEISGDGVIYKWSDELVPGHPCCVLAVDDDFLAAQSDAVVRYLAAHIASNEWVQETLADTESDNYTLLMDMGADFSERSTAVVESSFNHMKLEYEMSTEWQDSLKWIIETYEALDMFSSTLQDRGYDNASDFVDQFVMEDLLQQALLIEPWTFEETTGVRVGYLGGDLHQAARLVCVNEDVGMGLYGNDTTIFEAFGIDYVASDGSPYASGGEEMDGFALGNIDIGYLGSPPAILKHINLDIGIHVISQVNSEGSAIFLAEDVDDPSTDFEGMIFATPGPASIQHMMFMDHMEDLGYTVKAA